MPDDGRFDDITQNLRSFGPGAEGDGPSPEPVTATDGAGGATSRADAGYADDEIDLDNLTPEQRTQVEEAQRAMAEARERLMSVPAEVVVTNHVMGLYELAAIHLSNEEPDLAQASLAIDAVACLVDGLGDRLGPDAATLRDALTNIRLAFVQIKG